VISDTIVADIVNGTVWKWSWCCDSRISSANEWKMLTYFIIKKLLP